MTTTTQAPATRAIPADAVRVWRGFRSPNIDQGAFFDRLGTVFVPSTVLMQIDAGLNVYIPTVPGGMADKPATVPDETAILFWDSQQTYHDGFKTLACRTYTLTHGAVYTTQSRADFPVLYEGVLPLDQPVHLFTAPVDWQHRGVQHLVAGRPNATSPEDFRKAVNGVLAAIQQRAQAEAAIACLSQDSLVYWQAGGTDDPGVADLEALSGWHTLKIPAPTRLPDGLWDDWPGLVVAPGDSLNMQFVRRWER